MIAVITGDIVNSQKEHAETWLNKLKNLFASWARSPENWEIYRGDEIQIKCTPEEAFWKSVSIKSLIKTHENLDVRLAIGIGEEDFASEKITESNGSAYVYSGRLLSEIKEDGRNFSIATSNSTINQDLNLLFKWTSLDWDNWSAVSAEMIHMLSQQPHISQEQAAQKLNISQSSVSQRLKRANYELLLETDRYFRKKIKQL